jgi:endonuclease/exonuclease/phosphatase family metal-dependent hydrolase
MDLKIGTLNIKNNRINRIGGDDCLGNDNALILSDYIKDHHYDILGTQELTRKMSNRLINEYNLKLYGNYRYGDSKFVKKIKLLDDYNENNDIITDLDVMIDETYHLPFIAKNPVNLAKSIVKGSIMPRIMTSTVISSDSIGEIIVFNTHLDYQIPEIQIRQLKKIYEIIKRVGYAYPIVLMGDFNLELSKPYFKEFVDALNNLGLQRVEVNDKTNASKYSNKTAIDHIFIPQSWLISEAGLINHNKLKRVTDHKGVYVKIKV